MLTGTAYRRGLRTAIGGNALAVVVALSGCGAGDRFGPNRLDAGGYTLLMRAAENGNVSQIRRLTKAGADPNYQGRLVKHYSILFPFVSEEWVNVPRDSWTPLIVAARAGRADSIAALLAAGANPDLEPRLGVPGRTALWYASEAGHLEAARALADGGVNRQSWASTLPFARRSRMVTSSWPVCWRGRVWGFASPGFGKAPQRLLTGARP